MDPQTLTDTTSVILADGATFTQKVTEYRTGIAFVLILIVGFFWVTRGTKAGVGTAIGAAVAIAAMYSPELLQGLGNAVVNIFS